MTNVLPQSVFESEEIQRDFETIAKGIQCVCLASARCDTENIEELLECLKGSIQYLARDCFKAGMSYKGKFE